MNKTELRRRMRGYRNHKDVRWVETLRFWSVLKEANTVFCYLSLPDEPDTIPLIRWLIDNGRRVCVPYCNDRDGNMTAVVYRQEEENFDALGLVSSNGETVPVQEINLALVPALAFDSDGNRLGRGKGYYDRFLSSGFKGVSCGICPAMRFLSSVPADSHDCPVDYVFTPYGLHKTNDK